MAKLQEIKDVNKDKEIYVKGYRIALNTRGIKETGFTTDDDLIIIYRKGKITITKKN